MNAQQRMKLYTDFLTSEGYRPEMADKELLRFMHEGKTYFITVDDNDPMYFRLVYPNFWSIDDDDERVKVFLAANTTNREVKCVKVYVNEEGDDTWAAIEEFFDREHPENVRPVFTRTLRALQAGINNFRDNMQKMR
jgi:hypothetical protein